MFKFSGKKYSLVKKLRLHAGNTKQCLDGEKKEEDSA